MARDSRGRFIRRPPAPRPGMRAGPLVGDEFDGIVTGPAIVLGAEPAPPKAPKARKPADA